MTRKALLHSCILLMGVLVIAGILLSREPMERLEKPTMPPRRSSPARSGTQRTPAEPLRLTSGKRKPGSAGARRSPDVPRPTQHARHPIQPENEIQRLILQVTGTMDEVDQTPLLRVRSAALAEIERMLARPIDDRSKAALLSLYHDLLGHRPPDRTPEFVLRIARETTGQLQLAAVRILAWIADPPAIELLGKLIATTDGTTESERNLLSGVLDAAGRTHSTALRQAMEQRFLARPAPAFWVEPAVKAIGRIGFDADVDLLRRVQRRVRDDPQAFFQHKQDVHYAVKRAIDKIDVLTKGDREQNLLKEIERPTMSGTFAWHDWALDKILHLRLTHLAGSLRKLYEVHKKKAVDSPYSFTRKLLAAIHQLGGDLSADEIELLRKSGWID